MRAFRITVFAAPRVKPDGDPNASDGVYWSRTGSPWEGDLAALVGLLTTPTPAPGKYACPYFVAGSLHDGVRRGEHFELASVIGLDIDTGITSVETHRRFLDCAHVISMAPAPWTASVWTTTRGFFAFAIREISAIAWIVPTSLFTSITEMRRVSGRMAASTASTRITPSESGRTSVS